MGANRGNSEQSVRLVKEKDGGVIGFQGKESSRGMDGESRKDQHEQ